MLQYIELMKRLPVTELAQILPKLSMLIHDFQIGAECAMSVYRPLLRLLCGLNMDAAQGKELAGDENMQDAVIIPLPVTGKDVLGPRKFADGSEGDGWATGVVEVPVEAEEGASNPQEDLTPGVFQSSFVLLSISIDHVGSGWVLTSHVQHAD